MTHSPRPSRVAYPGPAGIEWPAVHRSLLWFVVLFAVGLGLGYPSVHRHDIDESPDDVPHYHSMVRLEFDEVPPPFRYRILVPTLAFPVHRVLSIVELGSWNREMAALLVVNAALMSLAALALIALGRTAGLRGSAIAMLPLFYLSAFAVANGHLKGLVDSAEALALCTMMVFALRGRWGPAALVIALSPLAKESTLLFSAVVGLVVLMHARWTRTSPGRKPMVLWLVGVGAGVGVLAIVHWAVGVGPAGMRAWPKLTGEPFLTGLLRATTAKSVVYSFALILPLGLFRLRRLPTPLLLASAVSAAVALTVAAAAGIGENVSRPLFNTCSPALCIASAILLGECTWERDVQQDRVERSSG